MVSLPHLQTNTIDNVLFLLNSIQSSKDSLKKIFCKLKNHIYKYYHLHLYIYHKIGNLKTLA
jgi:hypothetical protein